MPCSPNSQTSAFSATASLSHLMTWEVACPALNRQEVSSLLFLDRGQPALMGSELRLPPPSADAASKASGTSTPAPQEGLSMWVDHDQHGFDE